MTKSIGAWIVSGSLVVLGACGQQGPGSGESGGAIHQAPGPVQPALDAGSGQNQGCISANLGNQPSCRDEDHWKAAATMFCAALEIADLTLIGPCGTGEFQQATVQCCPQPSSPPPQQCETDTLNDPNCVGLEALQQGATVLCAGKMGAVSGLTPAAPCTDPAGNPGFNQAVYQCCW